MRCHNVTAKILSCFIVSLVLCTISHAQIDQTFKTIFSKILVDQLRLSPGEHGTHYLEADSLANASLVTALNNLIAGNISSFPLSSTSAGIKFDFSSGLPVTTTESLGPIFAETGETIGQGKINVGFNYSYLDLSKFRGLSTEEMRFTFAHKDLTPDDTIGNSPFESDYIDVVMGAHIKANIFASFATIGVTNNFDVGIAVPVISVSIQGTATAKINSFSYPRNVANGGASHYFGGDSLHPIFETAVPYEATSTGLGDLALRLKYSFSRGEGIDVASIIDVRLPTGKQENFLGTGKTKVRISAILSEKIGGFTPHVNLGYERNSSDFLSDRVLFTAGFDNKLVSGVTFAFEAFGSIDINSDKAIKLFPGSVTIYDRFRVGPPPVPPIVSQAINHVSLSNIPDRSNDNVVNASFGLRYAPADNVVMLLNVLAPLNDGGLRSSAVPTVGISIGL